MAEALLLPRVARPEEADRLADRLELLGQVRGRVLVGPGDRPVAVPLVADGIALAGRRGPGRLLHRAEAEPEVLRHGLAEPRDLGRLDVLPVLEQFGQRPVQAAEQVAGLRHAVAEVLAAEGDEGFRVGPFVNEEDARAEGGPGLLVLRHGAGGALAARLRSLSAQAAPRPCGLRPREFEVDDRPRGEHQQEAAAEEQVHQVRAGGGGALPRPAGVRHRLPGRGRPRVSRRTGRRRGRERLFEGCRGRRRGRRGVAGRGRVAGRRGRVTLRRPRMDGGRRRGLRPEAEARPAAGTGEEHGRVDARRVEQVRATRVGALERRRHRCRSGRGPGAKVTINEAGPREWETCRKATGGRYGKGP